MVNILVVDDEEPFRRLLKNELTRKGYSVSVAADGGEAQRLMSNSAFDAVLLDVVMPGMDGLSLMKTLKEDPSAPPIIVLTGKATVETAVEAMKNGAFDYLTKPYKLDELVILINRAHEYGRLSVKNQLLEQELDVGGDVVGDENQGSINRRRSQLHGRLTAGGRIPC